MCVSRVLASFHMWPLTTVSSIISVATHDDAFSEGSLSLTIPAFALPWVWRWLPFPLGAASQLHTSPLPAKHVGLATGLHTGRDPFRESLIECDFQVARGP